MNDKDITKKNLSDLEDLESPGEGVELNSSLDNSMSAQDIVLNDSETVNNTGFGKSPSVNDLIDYSKELIDSNAASIKSSEDTVPIYPEWNKMPVIKNQLEHYPNLCERVKTCVAVLDFKNKEDVDQYQSLLNQAQGESASIKLRNSIIKFSEQTGNFIALVIFDTFKFKRPL